MDSGQMYRSFVRPLPLLVIFYVSFDTKFSLCCVYKVKPLKYLFKIAQVVAPLENGTCKRGGCNSLSLLGIQRVERVIDFTSVMVRA